MLIRLTDDEYRYIVDGSLDQENLVARFFYTKLDKYVAKAIMLDSITDVKVIRDLYNLPHGSTERYNHPLAELVRKVIRFEYRVL